MLWIDGTEAQLATLKAIATATGEIISLDQNRYPGCIYHRSAPTDVARTEKDTYICTHEKCDAGPTNNWLSPAEAYRRGREYLASSMRGRTMYVVPFSMGHKIGIELTDSIYVVLNMAIISRVGAEVLQRLGSDGAFTRCLHSTADLNPARRLILHFPEDNTIWSVGSGYGGNALLNKKCLGLRLASHMSRREGWLAEHMLVMGVEDRQGRIEYIAAAFPSACGKTNLAMLVPPDGMRSKGYRVWTVGDDIAWMHIGSDGRLWAVNPEAGFFGVAPGTNSRSNPNMMRTIARDTIYTNVALTPEGHVWWEGCDDDPPANLLDWHGQPWKPDTKDAHGKPVPAAHANSRFTSPLANCPSALPIAVSAKMNDLSRPHASDFGVPISAILFGGRQASLSPLVYEAFDWEHGVFIGATTLSERTAAADGTVGEARRDPMAMLPFCGYNMGDYFDHWLAMGRRLTCPPKIFHVNWFRRDSDGKFLWPGYGENLRVLEWVLARARGEAAAEPAPIGYVPASNALDLQGLDISPKKAEKLFSVDHSEWQGQAEEIAEFFETFGDRFPQALWRQLKMLRQRLDAPLTFLKPGSELRPLAVEANEIIERENPHVFGMLSELGKRLFFPRGILAQSAEAKEKAKLYDATIGIARQNGKPMYLPAVMHYFNDISPADALTYAPATGRADLRKRWREEMLRKNPTLAGKRFSLPAVTGGLTHALSLIGDLFVNEGDMLLLPDKFWENYELIFGVRLQAQLALFPFFNARGTLDVGSLREVLATRGGMKTVLILNFPNNPTGYSITHEDAHAVVAALVEAADHGCDLVVVTDDAYFGLFYAEDVLKESLFAHLADRHERILAIKVDGPTKEEYVWGLRTGMITFSTRAATSAEALYAALEKKLAGAIRSTISNASHVGQTAMVKALENPSIVGERRERNDELEARAHKVMQVLSKPEYAACWEPYPFNAGYFMCLRLKELDAETYRKHLLDKYGVGVIADGAHDIRVAFSAVDLGQIEDLYAVMAVAAKELLDGRTV